MVDSTWFSLNMLSFREKEDTSFNEKNSSDSIGLIIHSQSVNVEWAATVSKRHFRSY